MQQSILQRPVATPAMRPSVISLDFSKLRQAWVRIGLATQPAERAAAEAAIRKAYRAAGLDAPDKVVWCDSPFAQGVARAIVLDRQFARAVVAAIWKHIQKPTGGVREDIKDTFCSSMRLFDTSAIKCKLMDAVKSSTMTDMQEQVSGATMLGAHINTFDGVNEGIWRSVWDTTEDCILQAIGSGIRKAVQMQQRSVLDDTVHEALRACAGEPVKAIVWDNVMENAWANIRSGADGKARVNAWKNLWEVLQKPIWDNIALPLGECVNACAKDSAQASGYGQHDAYWLSFYAYFREVEGLAEETEQITGLLDLAKSAGWFTPHRKVCWISERPNKLSLNDRGRLHADQGPALAYPDGWGVYATDGELRHSGFAQ